MPIPAAAIMSGLNIATSALPLFVGENNIFSGKAREASREQKKTFEKSQALQLPAEYQQALTNRLAQANIGIPGTALGLYQQQMGRGLSTQMAGLRDKRSALAGVGALSQAQSDAALNLAGMQAQALLGGQERANQALMQMGGLKYQEQLRKLGEAQDYWGARKAEANAAISSALSGLGQAVGGAVSSGAFNKAPSVPSSMGSSAPSFYFPVQIGNTPSYPTGITSPQTGGLSGILSGFTPLGVQSLGTPMQSATNPMQLTNWNYSTRKG